MCQTSRHSTSAHPRLRLSSRWRIVWEVTASSDPFAGASMRTQSLFVCAALRLVAGLAIAPTLSGQQVSNLAEALRNERREDPKPAPARPDAREHLLPRLARSSVLPLWK